MHPMLNTAVRAARRAGTVIVRHLNQLDRVVVEAKGRHDFVSDVDRRAEAEIIHVLKTAYPDHAILAEESGASAGSDYQWVIDPLDGTTNFLHGYPHFAVSIALRYQQRLEQAVIFDPLRNELFTASRGGGAHLNERRIRVSKQNGLDGALIGTGFPFKTLAHLEPWIAIFRAVVPLASGVRRAGSAALDLAHVACGRLDAFWEMGLGVWDVAAGALMVQEAGGLISDLAGEQRFMETGDTLAGTPRVHAEFLRLIEQRLPAAR